MRHNTIDTKHFGEVKYNENEVITFEEGIPGFGDITKFILLADSPNDLFRWLQSTEDTEVAFVLMDVKQIKPDYNPSIEGELIADLQNGTPLLYYNIAVVPEDLQQMRVNLKAPIIINQAMRLGKQVITSDEEYTVRHYIFDDIQKSQQNGQVIEC